MYSKNRDQLGPLSGYISPRPRISMPGGDGMSRLSNARTELENYEKTRPADYVSQYQPKIKNVMGQLDGMKEFDYDPDADEN